MSYSKFKKTFYNTKGQEKQLLNGIFTQHDLICACPSPQSHVAWLLFKHCTPTDFTEEEKQDIQKCLGTSPTNTTGGEDDAGIDEGELERLFAEDIPDDG